MPSKRILAGLALLALLFSVPAQSQQGAQEGVASYYADSLAGGATASGEPYDPTQMTAAHLTLAFGTRVRVTNLRNGKTVTVTINDRGPHAKGRILDVSGAAADALGMKDSGTAKVRLEVLE